jgi:hypothetical protein
MGLTTRALTDKADAVRLGELVYSAYGLTYHRAWMYDPERVLALHAQGTVASILAVDGDSGEIVGHLAALRPYFEVADEPGASGEASSAETLEIGLSLVHPDHRDRQVQNAMAVGLRMHLLDTRPDVRGFYMKCVAGHLRSQRSSQRFGGTATAIFLGGVPAWVVCDQDPSAPGQPLTTIAMHVPGSLGDRITVCVPERHSALLRGIYEAAKLERNLVPVGTATLSPITSELRTWFDPARRQGVVRVVSAGGDLVEVVQQRVRWLMKGHMEHITVLLPLSGPAAASAVPGLEEAGLFVGGVLPSLHGADTLVLEALDVADLDTARIQVIEGHSQWLLDQVESEWRLAAEARRFTSGPFRMSAAPLAKTG